MALQVGHVVLVGKGCHKERGVVKYVGTTDFEEGDWVGIELENPIGKNDGSVQGKRYFDCEANYGLFLPRRSSGVVQEEAAAAAAEQAGIPQDLKQTKALTSSRAFLRSPRPAADEGVHLDLKQMKAKLSEDVEELSSAATSEVQQLRLQVSELRAELSAQQRSPRQRESTGSAAAAEVQRLRRQVSELEAKLSWQERQDETEVKQLRRQASELQSRLTYQQRRYESASSTAAAEAEQLKGQVSELQAKLSEEEGKREAASSAAAAESEQLRRQVSELRSMLSEEQRQRESAGRALRQHVSELEAKLSEQEWQHEAASFTASAEAEQLKGFRSRLVDLRWEVSELRAAQLAEEQLQREPTGYTAATEGEAELWTCTPANGLPIDTREVPEIEGRRTGKTLNPGDTFRVMEEKKVGAVTFLRLAGGEGWVFDNKPNVGLMCTKVKAQEAQPAGGAGAPLSASALAAAPPSVQKQLIREKMFPMVAKYEPELAGKVTGMMLEMDNSELLILLESEQRLKGKVDETMRLLGDAKEGDQLPVVVVDPDASVPSAPAAPEDTIELTITRCRGGNAGYTVLWDPMRVAKVEPDGPACWAGMREGHVGWIITHMDGLEVTPENGRAALEATRGPGRAFTIRIKHPDKEGRQRAMTDTPRSPRRGGQDSAFWCMSKK